PCRDGGTGRRARLKIWYPKGCGGSIPPPGTNRYGYFGLLSNFSSIPIADERENKCAGAVGTFWNTRHCMTLQRLRTLCAPRTTRTRASSSTKRTKRADDAVGRQKDAVARRSIGLRACFADSARPDFRQIVLEVKSLQSGG